MRVFGTTSSGARACMCISRRMDRTAVFCVPLSIASIRPAAIATRVASAGRRCVSLFQQVHAQRYEVMGCVLRNVLKRAP
jgi:hypothetical protein